MVSIDEHPEVMLSAIALGADEDEAKKIFNITRASTIQPIGSFGAGLNAPSHSGQINNGAPHIHHDALEFPDGEIVLLTRLCEGQKATVLTLPTQPKAFAEPEVQQRAAHVG